MKRCILPTLTALLFFGCEAEEGSTGEPDNVTLTRFDPAVERDIETTADGFFAELTMLHEPEARAYVDFSKIGEREWEEYWKRLKSYDLEVGSVTLLRIEPPSGDDPDTAHIGVDAELLVNGEEVSVEAYRLPLARTPDGWRLTALPFTE